MARYMTAPLDLTIEELNVYQLIYKKADFNSWVSDYTLDQLSTDSHPALCISRKVASRIVNKLISLGYIEIVRVGVKGKPSLCRINKDCIYTDDKRNEYGLNRERIGYESVLNDEPIATVKGASRNKSGMNRERIGNESGHPIIKSKKETETIKEDAVYFDSLPLNNAMMDFIEHRKQIKKAMTDKAIKMTIDKVNKFNCSESDKVKAFEDAIINGWQGVFEPKSNQQTDTNYSSMRWV